MKTIFVTYAVKEEFIPLEIEGCNVVHIYTGVGKTKSAHVLTKKLCLLKPDLVLNIGTAGSLQHNIGDVFIANLFVDRDYEAVKLPGIDYEINGLELLNSIPQLKGKVLEYEKTGVCNTGDTFVTNPITVYGDIIEMEAFAQAYVCKEFDVAFLSIKYITDIIGENSVELWESKLDDARKKLLLWFKENNILSIFASQ